MEKSAGPREPLSKTDFLMVRGISCGKLVRLLVVPRRGVDDCAAYVEAWPWEDGSVAPPVALEKRDAAGLYQAFSPPAAAVNGQGVICHVFDDRADYCGKPSA